MRRADSHNAISSLIELSNSPPPGMKRSLAQPREEMPKIPRSDMLSAAAEAAMLLSPQTVMPMAIDLKLVSSRNSPMSAQVPPVLLTPSTMRALAASLNQKEYTKQHSPMLAEQRHPHETDDQVLTRPNLKLLSSFLADSESPDSVTACTPRVPWLSSHLKQHMADQITGAPRVAARSEVEPPRRSTGATGGSLPLLSTLGQFQDGNGITARWQASVWASLDDKDSSSKAWLAPLVSCDPSEVAERLRRVSSPQLAALPAEPRLLVQQFMRYLATRQGEPKPQPVRTTQTPVVLSQFDQLSRGNQRAPPTRH